MCVCSISLKLQIINSPPPLCLKWRTNQNNRQIISISKIKNGLEKTFCFSSDYDYIMPLDKMCQTLDGNVIDIFLKNEYQHKLSTICLSVLYIQSNPQSVSNLRSNISCHKYKWDWPLNWVGGGGVQGLKCCIYLCQWKVLKGKTTIYFYLSSKRNILKTKHWGKI